MTTPVAHTIRSACETYNIGRTSLYELLQSGAIAARKFGKKTLIRDADLQEWLNSLPVADPSIAPPTPNRRPVNNETEPAVV